MKVLVCSDNGPAAEEVCSKSLELAAALNAEMALLTVIDTQFLLTDGGITPQEVIEQSKTEQEKNLSVLRGKIFANKNVLTFIESGHIHDTILKVAEEWQANLIAMGTHGRKGISHAVMGSVAEKVIRNSKIPVFVIPVK